MSSFLWTFPGRDRERDTLYLAVFSSEKRTPVEKRSRASRRLVAWPGRNDPPGGASAYEAARKQGARSFTLWRDPDAREPYAHTVTRKASGKGGAEYEVQDQRGATLALIRRDPGSLLKLRRPRWTVSQTGRPTAVAREGRLVWWFLWLLVGPLSNVATRLTFALLCEDIDPPFSKRFRADGNVVLDYRAGEGDLEVRADWWDPRVTAALLILVHSWESKNNFNPHPSFP